jgi:hypothetical protein
MSELYLKKFNKLSQEDLTATFVELCYDGNLDAVSTILDNAELLKKVHKNYHDMAFVMACRQGHIDMIQQFQSHYSHLNFSVINGCESACYNNQKQVIEYLLSDNIVESNLDRIFDIAFNSKKSEIVKLILTSESVKKTIEANLMGTGYSQYNSVFIGSKLFHLNDMLIRSCEKNDLEMVKLLLLDKDIPKNADIHYLDDKALTVSCDKGHIDIVKFLLTDDNLKEHANIQIDDHQPIKNAVMSDNLELIKYLTTSPKLKEHADIHVQDDTIFKTALNNDSVDIVQFLLTDPNLKSHIDITKNIETIYDVHYNNMNDDDEYQYEALKYIVADYKYLAPNVESETLFIQILKSVPELHKLYEVNKLAHELNLSLSDKNNLNNIEPKRLKI